MFSPCSLDLFVLLGLFGTEIMVGHAEHVYNFISSAFAALVFPRSDRLGQKKTAYVLGVAR